ncbi:MAG: hypothetical protein IKR59_00260 [Lachnospiraceae bacterium]|nr:hypothetical protein [Lachnospiraceae bacterium]
MHDDHEHEYEHDHDHEHHHHHDHDHDHDHHHDHSRSGADTLTAVLGYMLDHNIHHCEELKGISEKLSAEGREEAAQVLLEGTALFDQANEKLAAALALLKE